MRLTATNLDVAHGRTQVLFGASMGFAEGGSTCVLGRNGAGKTSLMNAIMDALEAHTTMSSQALASERVRDGLKDILMGPAQLYETLRAQGEVARANG